MLTRVPPRRPSGEVVGGGGHESVSRVRGGLPELGEAVASTGPPRMRWVGPGEVGALYGNLSDDHHP